MKSRLKVLSYWNLNEAEWVFPEEQPVPLKYYHIGI